jgi:orotidine-5'-phosphate decarboxylase
MQPKDRLILALDFADIDLAHELADRVRQHFGYVKVGLPLVIGSGLSSVERLRRAGHQIFLDLKYHDIPSSVQAAVRESARQCARLVTVHALGGPSMLRAAVRALSDLTIIPGEQPPRLLAVTILTHLTADELKAIGISEDPKHAAVTLAKIAQDAGIDGVVASPQEVAAIRKACGNHFLIVCPGIRPAGSQAGDQARIATPAQAIRDGADYLVIGRPIRNATDPVAAAKAIVDEITQVC